MRASDMTRHTAGPLLLHLKTPEQKESAKIGDSAGGKKKKFIIYDYLRCQHVTSCDVLASSS